MNVIEYCEQVTSAAQAASRKAMSLSGSSRNAALRAIAQGLLAKAQTLKDANAKDIAAGQAAGLSVAMLDRLRLDDKAIAKMAESVRQVAEQTDPVGQVIEGSVRPSGLRLQKVRVPIGVVLIIFESRPNVTSDAAALCLKSGNACILRGGKESIHSNQVIADVIREAILAAGLPADLVQVIQTPDRQVVTELLKMEGRIDLVVPRGGESLIRAVVESSRIPVIKHYTGNCHVYVDASADPKMALDICLNAKTQRTGVCNAAESLLFHKSAVASGLLKRVCDALTERKCEIRGCDVTRSVAPQAKPATEQDWAAEYLDLIVAIKVVDSLDQAIDHINQYSSKHTDAIVTSELANADRFVLCVDTANAFVNASTRLSDGGEYGLGAEIGISTDKLHARGPMGAQDLTTYKWIGYGNGTLRG